MHIVDGWATFDQCVSERGDISCRVFATLSVRQNALMLTSLYACPSSGQLKAVRVGIQRLTKAVIGPKNGSLAEAGFHAGLALVLLKNLRVAPFILRQSSDEDKGPGQFLLDT